MIFLIRLYQILNVYQQSHYETSYLSWVRKKYLIRYGPLIVFYLLSFFYKYFYIIMTLYCFIPMRFKKRLVITKRVVRLGVTSILISLFFIHNLKMYYGFVIFTDFIVLLANYINKPIEKKIYHKYFNKGKDFFDSYLGTKIAITGSYGKTSFKNYLQQTLDKPTYATPNSYNTPMGVVKSIDEANDLYDYYICEMGASRIGDIGELMKLVKPDICILTSIGPQHLQTFKTMDNIIKEKFRLIEELDYSKTAFINVSNEYIRDYPLKTKAMVITYGDGGMYHLEEENEGFKVYCDNECIGHFFSKLKRKTDYENLLGVIAVCDYLGVNTVDVISKIYGISPVVHRANKTYYKEYVVIDDSFNSNLRGAMEAIDSLDGKHKYIITPGFVELSEMSKLHHEKLAFYIMEKNVFPILVKGNDIKYMRIVFEQHNYPFKICPSFKEGYNWFLKTKEKDSCLLIENDLPDNY